MKKMITKKSVSIVILLVAIGWFSLFAFDRVEKSNWSKYESEKSDLNNKIKVAEDELELYKDWISVLESDLCDLRDEK